MSSISTIAISPSGAFLNESGMINQLFDAGLHRYHIDKSVATEQSIAEILEGVEPKYLGKITLHSHFHLVLAYGVGGIHYSLDHRKVLGDDYLSKVQLYQGFGVKVSTEVGQSDWSPADYALSTSVEVNASERGSLFLLTKELSAIQSRPAVIILEDILIDRSREEIIQAIKATC